MGILLDLYIIAVSLRGSIIETFKRSKISLLLFLRAFIGFFQCFSSCIYIVYLIAYLIEGHVRNHKYFPCDNYKDDIQILLHKIFYILLILSQLVDFSGLLCCCYWFSAPRTFDRFYSPSSKVSSFFAPIGDKKSDDVSTSSYERLEEGEVTETAQVGTGGHHDSNDINGLSTPRRTRATSQWARCCQRSMRSCQIFSCNIFGGNHLMQNESAFEVKNI